MQIADHIACLRAEGNLLARAAERAGLDAPVPACPGWRIRDLLAHLGFVHRWAAAYVAEQRTDMTREPGEEEIAALAPADASLAGWFREGHAALVSVLSAADPATRCWTFLAASSPLAFWARRQAHETAIHRVDAQLAVAAAGPGAELDPFPAGLAADGIDELLTGFAARRPQSLADAPARLVIRAEDGAATPCWTVRMGSQQAGVSRGPGPATTAASPWPGPAAPAAGGPDGPAGAGPVATAAPAEAYCEVSGPAPALYLLLWNRGTAAGLDIRGDARVLATWRERMRVRWH